jgi:assimilatory nitrate reductase electron transfer subunit
MTDIQSPPAAPGLRRILVVGNGMAGARLAEELRQRDPEARRFAVTVVGEEPHPAYNRVLLSNVIAGAIAPRETHLRPDGWWATRRIDVVTGTRVTAVDPDRRTAVLSPSPGFTLATSAAFESWGRAGMPGGGVITWDELVFATGSTPFVPPIASTDEAETGTDRAETGTDRAETGTDRAETGTDRAETGSDGVIAFRTVDDCRRILDVAESARTAVVVGGGLLGLEAARGLLAQGLAVTVVHPADFPMERQLDADGGAVLARVVRALGASLVLGRFVSERRRETDGSLTVVLDDGTSLPADLVVVSAGVRPRVDLARAAGVEVDRAIVVDDRLATSAPHVHAIGECAQHRGEVPGLVQPGWDQARVLADVLAGDLEATYEGTSMLTRLKAHDIDLASMGSVAVDVHDPEHEVLAFTDPSRGRYAKLVLRSDRVVGAILLGVGDAAGPLTQLYDTGSVVPRDRLALLLGRAVARAGAYDTANLAEMPGSVVICRCNTVTKSAIVGAYRAGAGTVADVADATRATTGCGSCTSAVEGICSWLRSSEPDINAPDSAVPQANSPHLPNTTPLSAPAALAQPVGAPIEGAA